MPMNSTQRRLILHGTLLLFVSLCSSCDRALGDDAQDDPGGSEAGVGETGETGGEGGSEDPRDEPTQGSFSASGVEEAPPCPLSAAECSASWPNEGQLERWSSVEDFGGSIHERQSLYYRPPQSAGERLPLLIFLHGGNSRAAKMFARSFDELARGGEGTWRSAREGCEITTTGFRTPEGERCHGTPRSYNNQQRFALLFPEGIPSVTSAIEGARHWEDGRTPSPGQGVDEATRDDVGYLAHLVERASALSEIDSSRIYLGGWSNGGMMTLRALCEAERPGREPLLRVAAAVIGVASMPANLYRGAAGRPRCEASSSASPAIYWQVGHGLDTADCERYGCESPVVSGDGRMPFGEPGGEHRVNSPDLGLVRSFEDSAARMSARLSAAYGEAILSVERLGRFTERRVVSFGGLQAMEQLLTEGASHSLGGSRFEFQSEARQWGFLSRYARADDGSLLRSEDALVTGEH